MLYLQSIATGALIGVSYALVALGFQLVLGVLKVVNFAHGQIVMLGMYGAWLLFQALAIDPFIGASIVLVGGLLLGFLIYLGVIRPILRAAHIMQFVLTFGLLVLLQNTALFFFGATNKSVIVPYRTASIEIVGIMLSVPRLFTAAMALCIFVVVWLIVARTRIGKAMRAVADDREAAEIIGLPVHTIYLIALGIATAAAAVAGAALASYSSINPFVGLEMTLSAFIIIIIAGPGSIGGVMVVGLLLGIVEALGVTFLSRAAPIIPLLLVVIILLFRPAGLFGAKDAS